jgi:predicted Rossmann fold nucleotide-binding protein DprA/Smf involved in DNA uptake
VAGADAEITDSFNSLANSGAAPELKAQLQELLAAVAKLCEKLPAELAETTARDARTFVEEASSAKPRKNILETIGQGLKSAANFAVDVGIPVAQLVTMIIALF